jgi:hypothetical protein
VLLTPLRAAQAAAESGLFGGLPVLDYAPQTLLGVAVLFIFAGWLVPYRTVKEKDARIAYLEGALTTTQAALAEEQKTGKVVRHFFEGLGQGASS